MIKIQNNMNIYKIVIRDGVTPWIYVEGEDIIQALRCLSSYQFKAIYSIEKLGQLTKSEEKSK